MVCVISWRVALSPMNDFTRSEGANLKHIKQGFHQPFQIIIHTMYMYIYHTMYMYIYIYENDTESYIVY